MSDGVLECPDDRGVIAAMRKLIDLQARQLEAQRAYIDKADADFKSVQALVAKANESIAKADAATEAYIDSLKRLVDSQNAILTKLGLDIVTSEAMAKGQA